MPPSELLKLDRAAERIAELNELLREKRPFYFVLRTNTETGERSLFTKQDEAVVARAALIAGDAAHNIRTALDHAYWAIVSPYATGPRDEKAVQFPFSQTSARLEEAIKNRLAHRVSQRFFDAMIRLAPHPQQGGNHMLYLIDQIDAPDKHRRLTPMADYARLSSDIIRQEVPDFPMNVTGQVFISGCVFNWRTNRVDVNTLGENVPPFLRVFEKKLHFPMEIVFEIGQRRLFNPAVSTLSKLVDVAKETIAIMNRAKS